MTTIAEFEHYCPDCGKWINAGEAKFANDGQFIVHQWCN